MYIYENCNNETSSSKNYTITKKKSFFSAEEFEKQEKTKVLKFAYDMTFGEVGAHRTHRTGGKKQRKHGEIFANTLQGKLAEVAASKYLNISGVDYSTETLGIWDDADLEYKDRYFSIKSAKHFSNLLLLEKKIGTKMVYIFQIEINLLKAEMIT